MYHSPSGNKIQDLIRYLFQTVDRLNSRYSSSEVVIPGDFNRESAIWKKSNKTNTQLFSKPIFLSNQVTVVPTLRMTDPQCYTDDVSSLVGNSEHAIIEVQYLTYSERIELRPLRIV